MNEYVVAVVVMVMVRAESTESAKVAARRAVEVGNVDSIDVEEPLFVGEAQE